MVQSAIDVVCIDVYIVRTPEYTAKAYTTIRTNLAQFGQ